MPDCMRHLLYALHACSVIQGLYEKIAENFCALRFHAMFSVCFHCKLYHNSSYE
jgi:hypothetical protein